MSSLIGHLIPGSFFFFYGFLFYLDSIHTHYLLTRLSTQRYINPKSPRVFNHISNKYAVKDSVKSSDILYSDRGSEYQEENDVPFVLTSLSLLFLNRRLSNLLYCFVVILCLSIAVIQYAAWNGSYREFYSLQISVYYFMISLVVGCNLLIDSDLINHASRYIMPVLLLIASYMLININYKGMYLISVYGLLSQIFQALSITSIFYIAAYAAAMEKAEKQSILADSINQKANSSSSFSDNTLPNSLYISPSHSSIISILSRIVSSLFMLSGTWLYHVGFSLHPPWLSTTVIHPDHDSHVVYMQATWHFMGILALGIMCDIAFRYHVNYWPALTHSNETFSREFYNNNSIKKDMNEVRTISSSSSSSFSGSVSEKKSMKSRLVSKINSTFPSLLKINKNKYKSPESVNQYIDTVEDDVGELKNLDNNNIELFEIGGADSDGEEVTEVIQKSQLKEDEKENLNNVIDNCDSIINLNARISRSHSVSSKIPKVINTNNNSFTNLPPL